MRGKWPIDSFWVFEEANVFAGEPQMTTAIRSWTQSHRYQATVRQLKALSSSELQALGIAPAQIEHLAIEASRS